MKLDMIAIEIGINHKFPHWDSSTIDIISEAFSDLLLNRIQADKMIVDDFIEKFVKLAFIFLSRSIALKRDRAYESFKQRAMLLDRYSSILYGKIQDERFDALSDYCRASQAFSKYGFIHESQVLMKKAIAVYSEEVINSEKDAPIRDMSGLVKVGKHRNDELYERLLTDYQRDELSVTSDSFNNFIQYNQSVPLAS